MEVYMTTVHYSYIPRTSSLYSFFVSSPAGWWPSDQKSLKLLCSPQLNTNFELTAHEQMITHFLLDSQYNSPLWMQ